ncbi:CHASE domain-containing protein [Terrihabitans sp. B22-R8]|uniref:CHASE domain-containing protein n=1 Tax=Terrihabitans sp. B22-R8 TaxID=3425128 RepID=UPI00403C82E6
MAVEEKPVSRRRFSFRRAALPALILVAGMLCTVLASAQLMRQVEQVESARFNNLVQDQATAIVDRIDTYVALLRGAAGLFAASGDVTEEEFRAYFSRLNAVELYPGVQGIGYATIVAPTEVESFVAQRQGARPGFALSPATPRDFYTSIVFLEPQDIRNERAIGFDMFTEPRRRSAMERARDTGVRAATGKVVLVQEEEGRTYPGFLLYVPVYETSDDNFPQTVEARRAALKGWVYSPFRTGDLFTKAFGLRNRTGELQYAIYDGSDADEADLLFRSGANAPGRYTARHILDVAGQTWVMRASSTPSFMEDSNRALIPYVIGGGLLTTLFLFAASLAQSRATAQAQIAREELSAANSGLEHRVEERTAQLESARHALETLNRNLETRVSIRTADLQEANEEMQRFTYIVSHDLRSPLVNVMGFTSELDVARESLAKFYHDAVKREPGNADETARLAIEEDLPEAIDFIRSSTAKMDRLINAILKLSREGRRILAPEPIDLTALMETIAKSLAQQIDTAGAEIEIEPLPEIVSDRVALEQIFSNLVENAVKYLAPGRPGQVKVRGWSEGTTIAIDVEDNGRGIDVKDHSRVFDLFRRAGAQDRPGEGIGLAHVRALVRRLGGTITLSSEEGQGSTFRVRLPKTLTRTEGHS